MKKIKEETKGKIINALISENDGDFMSMIYNCLDGLDTTTCINILCNRHKFTLSDLMDIGFTENELTQALPELMRKYKLIRYNIEKYIKSDVHSGYILDTNYDYEEITNDLSYILTKSSDSNIVINILHVELFAYYLNKGYLIPKKYEDYQFEWLKERGYSLYEIINAFSDYTSEFEIGNIKDEFHNWELDCGFSGEIYVSQDEYYMNDFFYPFSLEEIIGHELFFYTKEGITYKLSNIFSTHATLYTIKNKELKWIFNDSINICLSYIFENAKENNLKILSMQMK